MRALASPAPAAAAFLPRTPSPALSRHRGSPGGRAVAASAAATGDHWGADDQQHHREQQQYRGGAGRGGTRRAGPSVQCDVDVVSWRERRVFASVAVAADVDTVWRIITDYERLADFVPNLVHRSASLVHRRLGPFTIGAPLKGSDLGETACSGRIDPGNYIRRTFSTTFCNTHGPISLVGRVRRTWRGSRAMFQGTNSSLVMKTKMVMVAACSGRHS